ncbi:glycoside hydrolase family protein [Aeromonas lacus]
MEIRTNAFVQRIMQNEGTKEYQRKMQSYRKGQFFVYKCSEGFDTIGYGHLCTPQEVQEYKNGISELKAITLLQRDLLEAENDARRLFEINRHSLEVQQLLVEMVFQLGANTASKFKQFKAALDAKDYNRAALELIDSRWYKQTPNRVQLHVDVLRKQ